MQLSGFRKIEALKPEYLFCVFGDGKISSKTDGAGHHSAPIVIYVFTDQVDSAGTKKDMIWFFLKALLKFLFYIRHCILNS